MNCQLRIAVVTAVLTVAVQINAQQPSNAATAKLDNEAFQPPEATAPDQCGIWQATSPDLELQATSRQIPDSVRFDRTDRDGTRIGVFRLQMGGSQRAIASHDFNSRLIARARWSRDSKFLVFTTESTGGHSAWHYAAFVYCVDDASFRDIDAKIGTVIDREFDLLDDDKVRFRVQRPAKSEKEEDNAVTEAVAVLDLAKFAELPRL